MGGIPGLPAGRILGTRTLHFSGQVSDHGLTCPTPPSASPRPHCGAKNRIWETHPWLRMGLHGERTPLLMCQIWTRELYCICRAWYKSQIPWCLEENLCPASRAHPRITTSTSTVIPGSEGVRHASVFQKTSCPATSCDNPVPTHCPKHGAVPVHMTEKEVGGWYGACRIVLSTVHTFYVWKLLTQLISSAHISQATYLFIHYLSLTHLMCFIHSVCFSHSVADLNILRSYRKHMSRQI